MAIPLLNQLPGEGLITSAPHPGRLALFGRLAAGGAVMAESRSRACPDKTLSEWRNGLLRQTLAESHLSASPCRLDRGDVDLLHVHHRLEGALGRRLILAGNCFHEHPRGDLPGQAPPVLAPAALACDSPVLDDRIPVPIRLDRKSVV